MKFGYQKILYQFQISFPSKKGGDSKPTKNLKDTSNDIR